MTSVVVVWMKEQMSSCFILFPLFLEESEVGSSDGFPQGLGVTGSQMLL